MVRKQALFQHVQNNQVASGDSQSKVSEENQSYSSSMDTDDNKELEVKFSEQERAQQMRKAYNQTPENLRQSVVNKMNTQSFDGRPYNYYGLPQILEQLKDKRIDIKAGIKYLNILLVGQQELGKSTFGSMLLQPFNQHGSTRQTLNGQDEEKVANFETLSKEEKFETWKMYKSYVSIPMKYEEDAQLIVSVQETPFALTKHNSIDLVVDYVQNCFQIYLDQEFSQTPFYDIIDTRVDMCIYFLPPFGNMGSDIEAIRRLSQVVSVMPVISRADCLCYAIESQTLQVLQRKKYVQNILDMQNISYLDFPREIMAKAQATEAQQDSAIFAVGGAKYTKVNDQIMPMITYKFDFNQDINVNVMYTTDSQLVQSLLLDEGLKYLKSLSQSKYIIMRNKNFEERFRIERNQMMAEEEKQSQRKLQQQQMEMNGTARDSSMGMRQVGQKKNQFPFGLKGKRQSTVGNWDL